MIEIKNNRIYFYNTEIKTVPQVDFECMSAYICPACGRLLMAYYAGQIKTITDYLETNIAEFAYYYELGNKNGGQFLILSDHKHTGKCNKALKLASHTARGMSNSVTAWLTIHETSVNGQLDNIINAIETGKIPGFTVVTDACGNDEPILLYSEPVLIGNSNHVGFDERWARKEHLGEYLIWRLTHDEKESFNDFINPPSKETDKKPDSDEQPTEPEHTIDSKIEIISTYSRAEAIKDGVLIDVSKIAKENGIIYPVAITQKLWADYITPPEELTDIQDKNGRLWDVLTMLRFKIKAMSEQNTILYFKVIFQMPTVTGGFKPVTVELKSICGPGDNMEPVITIMCTDED